MSETEVDVNQTEVDEDSDSESTSFEAYQYSGLDELKRRIDVAMQVWLIQWIELVGNGSQWRKLALTPNTSLIMYENYHYCQWGPSFALVWWTRSN